ncbi:NACHT domain-containing protein [Actinokineospora xionganensis]|uniref:NACHT domain-containing protein n=1 Tax=Actinokineospora xionganensis TaxID=2684470 RepID=A0ABR7LBQ1_9PSEU|nr:NACHT domain-containing protein [Actinokineospora xionganensis]MBC6450136.1 NACHT domain-containing protein [Actinokineospora xionganensis]
MQRHTGFAVESASGDSPLKLINDYLAVLGWRLPAAFIAVLAGLLLLGVVLTIIKPLAPLVRQCWIFTTWIARRRVSAERRRQRRRRMFATHVDDQLRHLELQEDWRDEKYAELEAEVEVERSWRGRWLRKLMPFRRAQLQRVKSLSSALARSAEPLVLLEGEPGAGKSVALRHLARKLARSAADSRDPRSVIPLYLNLKSLDVRPEQVSPDEIRRFVLTTLNEVNSRDVQDVLDEEFDRGLEEGTWLFLFDSFDEIPDLLSAEDAREIAPRYARAIAGFLGPFTRCRGIVASRDFSSPDIVQFTRFRILRLSQRQQQRLITRADLQRPVDRALRAGLATASRDITTFAGNPMFLGLLCEHLRNGVEFPASSHSVFEEYLAHRLRRDAERIEARFGVGVEFVRAGAEEVAFLMAATPRMGLTPERSTLRGLASSMERLAPTSLTTVLDVLEYSKLGRGDTNAGNEPTFSFVHRRFQEYFATCVVIRDFARVPVTALIDNDQWRETAVTLLQSQEDPAVIPLIDEAHRRLCRYTGEVSGDRFRWPSGCLHLLGILATGLEINPGRVPAEMRTLVDDLLTSAWSQGHRLDKRRSLAFVSIASTPTAEHLLTEAFRSRNDYLREGAFRAAGSLPDLTDTMRGQIRRTLLGVASTSALYTKRASTVAQVKRLARPAEFLRLLALLTFAMPLALGFSVGGTLAVMTASDTRALVLDSVAWLVAQVFIVVAAAAVLRTLFSTAALRRGGRLGAYPAPPLEDRLWRGAVITIMLVLNTLLCTASVGALMGGPSIPALALSAYGALWAPAVIWVARRGIGIHPALWLILPALLVTIGTARLPGWFRERVEQVWVAGTSPRRLILDYLSATLRSVVLRLAGYTLVAIVIAVLGAAMITVMPELYGPTPPALLVWAFGIPLMAAAAVQGAVSGLGLLPRAARARSADDVLDLFARARGDEAVTLLTNRFTSLRLNQDPEVRAVLEDLVGEIERAQLIALLEQRLCVRESCPSLAAREVPAHPVLDSYPLRRWTRLRVRSVREETIDDLARLAEQE